MKNRTISYAMNRSSIFEKFHSEIPPYVYGLFLSSNINNIFWKIYQSVNGKLDRGGAREE